MDIKHLTIEREEQKNNMPSTYLVKNTVNNQYIRLGMNETYYLLTVLNAQDKKESLGMDAANELPLNLKEILNGKFEEWGFLDEGVKKAKKNPLEKIKKIHIVKFNVKKVLDVIYPIYSKVFTKEFFIALAVMLAVLAGFFIYAFIIFAQYQSIGGAPEVNLKLSSIDILMILLFFLINTFFHEFAHAVTCVKYGGKVTSMGLMLFYLIPCFYCDVSSVYQFKNKKHRAIVAVSGIMVNLFIGCLLMFVSFILASFNIVNIALFYMAISTVFVSIYNLIPFVKLDGYWFLQALTGIDNLMDKSVILAYTSVFARRKLKELNITRLKRILLSIYGVISIFFHQIFWISSFISIYSIFDIKGDWFIYICGIAFIIILFDFIKTIQHYRNIIKRDFDRILMTI